MSLDSGQTDERDTIVAISTPPGRGGIGIVRLSGPRARDLAEPLLRLRHPLAPAQARFGHLLDAAGEVLDEAVVTFFAAPHSYTSEDLVEIALHGSPVLLEELLRRALAGGARLAEPGEFTQRAFLSGRLDLTQAEAVHDLIASSTLEQARQAARQLGGALSRQVQPVKQRLIALIATLEAGIDFAEDDIDVLPAAEILAQLTAVQKPLQELERSFSYGRILREGFTLALVGRPNAGKSSLFNRLLDRNRAIVTAAPGTTRDPIHERLSIGGIPVELIDTAGLRDAPSLDEAEQLGIAKSREAMADADLLLLAVDTTEPLHPEDLALLESTEPRTLLLVLNKIDLPQAQIAETPHKELARKTLRTSALTGEGIDDLRNAILSTLRATSPGEGSAIVTNLRQHRSITEALQAIDAATRAIDSSLPHEVALVDLYAALGALDSLTGATTPDDILHRIFATFCIGK